MKLPQRPPELIDLMSSVDGPDRLVELISLAEPVDRKGRYLHWDEMRNRTPPDDLSLREWWLATSMARRSISRELPLTATDGRAFRYCNIDQIQEMVHRIDQQASGQILAHDLAANLRSSDRYLVSSLIEEAITSSQLEGADTTRKVAKELLATGRRPRDRSEQMIVNNYQAMVFTQELASHDLTAVEILDLHRVVTEDTLDDPADAGRLQVPSDERIAVYWHDGTVLHEPPPADELPSRLAALCRFANGEATDGFIHPVVRAVIVHFLAGLRASVRRRQRSDSARTLLLVDAPRRLLARSIPLGVEHPPQGARQVREVLPPCGDRRQRPHLLRRVPTAGHRTSHREPPRVPRPKGRRVAGDRGHARWLVPPQPPATRRRAGTRSGIPASPSPSPLRPVGIGSPTSRRGRTS